MRRSLLVPLAAAMIWTSSSQAAPINAVPTAAGQVRGTQSADGAVAIFRGIPYAQPPVGELRWKPPLPPKKWAGIRESVEFGPVCYQPVPSPGASLFTELFFTPTSSMSEDCLTLNIWAPVHAAKPLPVMFWIPGGGFRGGAAADPLYDGEQLARKGVVLVSINYRLSKLGFMAHPELTAESEHHGSGNYGLMDQIAALAWVRQNIAAFGGDPKRVTIFGQSAGGYSVTYLMVAPPAKGLFARAIGESSGGFAPERPGSILSHSLVSLTDAEKVGLRLQDTLHAHSLAGLRAVPAADLVAAPTPDPFDARWPILDGYVLRKSVMASFAAGEQAAVPTLTGTTSDETTLFPNPHTLAEFQTASRAQMGELYERFAQLYPAHDDASARAASEHSFRERLAGWSEWRWARAQTRTAKGPLYYYYFEHVPPAPQDKQYVENLGSRVGAFHGAELPYVFGNDYPADFHWTAADHALSDMMKSYWVNFAAKGDPNGPGLPRWVPVSGDEPQALIIGDGVAMGPLVNKPLYDFWDDYARAWDDAVLR